MDKSKILARMKRSGSRTLAAFRWNRKLLSTSYGTGKWTAREVLAHIADSELVFVTRLRFMLAEENPAVQPWDADRWAEKFSYRTADIPALRETYALMRRTLMALYKASDAKDLARPGRHPEYSNYTAGIVAEYAFRHNEHHLEQLDAIKAGRTWTPSGDYEKWRASIQTLASSRAPLPAK